MKPLIILPFVHNEKKLSLCGSGAQGIENQLPLNFLSQFNAQLHLLTQLCLVIIAADLQRFISCPSSMRGDSTATKFALSLINKQSWTEKNL